MNILLLYNARETFTNTVFEHVSSFGRFSSHRYFYCHHDCGLPLDADLDRFDAVGIHYCVRLPYDQISPAARERLAAYRGLKFLFIQDEYEHTRRAWHWIQSLGIQLVFTVVPEAGVARVYPPEEFPGVRFVSNLTGYVPEHPASAGELLPPSQRTVLVGYRGRPLPLVQFGELAYEKTRIGEMVRAWCRERGLPHDIEWREEARIYGPRWYEFVASCRATLGTESGSNVFDWDGRLRDELAAYRVAHPRASDESIYREFIAPREMHGLMNQVSPRIFEAISLRTVLVLFEGGYSGVVEPWKHYIPLRKDGGNLEEVFERLADGEFVDAMAQRAYDDVIASGRFGYPNFVRMTDRELETAAAAAAPFETRPRELPAVTPTPVTTAPVRAAPPQPPVATPAPVAAPQEQPEQSAPQEVEVTEHELALAVQPAVLPSPVEVRRQRDSARRALRLSRFKTLVLAGWQQLPPGVRPVLRPLARRGVLPAWRLLRRAYSKLRS